MDEAAVSMRVSINVSKYGEVVAITGDAADESYDEYCSVYVSIIKEIDSIIPYTWSQEADYSDVCGEYSSSCGESSKGGRAMADRTGVSAAKCSYITDWSLCDAEYMFPDSAVYGYGDRIFQGLRSEVMSEIAGATYCYIVYGASIDASSYSND